MSPTDPPSPQSDPSRPRTAESASSRGHYSRRTFLTVAGTAATSALAGCSVLNDDTSDAAFHDGDWHSYGNDPTNANRVAGGAPEPADHEALFPTNWPYTPPVVHEGVVYVATERDVAAVTTDGSERWSRDLDVEVAGAPALDPDHGRLYVPTRVVRTEDGPDPAPASVTALSLADGEVVRTLRVGERKTYGVTVVDGDVYARGATACVRFAPDGSERWRRSLDPLIYDEFNLGDSTATQIPPAVAGDGVYVPDRDALVKLDRASGEERVRVPVDTPYAAPVADDDGVVQTGWQETVAVDRAGEVRWRRDLHSRAAAAVADGDVYVVAGDLHELDAATGETNWQTHLPTEGTAAPVVTDRDVLVSTGDVRAFRRDADGGVFGQERERWRVSSVHAAAFASPVVAAGHAFVTGPTGLVAFRSEARS